MMNIVCAEETDATNRKAASLNAEHSMADVLRACQSANQSVEMHLRNGDTLGGKVAQVGLDTAG